MESVLWWLSCHKNCGSAKQELERGSFPLFLLTKSQWGKRLYEVALMVCFGSYFFFSFFSKLDRIREKTISGKQCILKKFEAFLLKEEQFHLSNAISRDIGPDV